MITHSKTHILARLEIGLRTDAARLAELEQQLTHVLQRGRGLGSAQVSPAEWNIAWDHHWDLVKIILCRIHDLVSEIQNDVQSSATDRHHQALQTWAKLQLENARLQQSLSELQNRAEGLPPSTQAEWTSIATTLQAHLELIQNCADALRIKLELLKSHSSAEVHDQVQKLLLRLSRNPPSQTSSHTDSAEEYQHAAAELQQEKNKFMGFMDVVKGMFLWVESPPERADKNHPLTRSVQ